MATNAGPRPANSSSAASSADADSAERGGHSSKETKRPAPIRSETVATRAAYCGGARRRPRSGGRRRAVLVAQQPLVELARRVARQLGAEVDGARALVGGELRAAERDELAGEVRAGGVHRDRLDDCDDLLAQLLVRHAEDRDVGDRRV